MNNVKEHIAVTGSTGFVGLTLCSFLLSLGYKVRALVRCKDNKSEIKFLHDLGAEILEIGNLLEPIKNKYILNGVDIVIHLAAKAHVNLTQNKLSTKQYSKVFTNIEMNLLELINSSLISRLIYLSSTKIYENNDGTLTESTIPNPTSIYGKSKYMSENLIKSNFSNYTIIRPPLVYGPRVKANFLTLLKVVKYGIPIPLGSIDNKRSYLYIYNLMSAIEQILKNEKSIAKTYLVADSEGISTGNLIRLMAKYQIKKVRLFDYDENKLLFLSKIFNKKVVLEKIIGNLELDCTLIKESLNWEPPYSVRECIENTCKWFMKR